MAKNKDHPHQKIHQPDTGVSEVSLEGVVVQLVEVAGSVAVEVEFEVMVVPPEALEGLEELLEEEMRYTGMDRSRHRHLEGFEWVEEPGVAEVLLEEHP